MRYGIIILLISLAVTLPGWTACVLAGPGSP